MSTTTSTTTPSSDRALKQYRAGLTLALSAALIFIPSSLVAIFLEPFRLYGAGGVLLSWIVLKVGKTLMRPHKLRSEEAPEEFEDPGKRK